MTNRTFLDLTEGNILKKYEQKDIILVRQA